MYSKWICGVLLLLCLYISLSVSDFITDSYYSSCVSQNSKWRKNTGSEIISWIRSIIPSLDSINSNGSTVSFKRNPSSFEVYQIVNSQEGLMWQKFGDQFLEGWLYGVSDENGSLRRENLSFIYPDLVTIMRGSFNKDFNFEKVTEGKITQFRCRHGFMELKISSSSSHSDVYSYERATNQIASSTPLLRDSYERKHVYISKSKAYSHLVGDSLYARKYIGPQSLVAYYNGILVSRNEQLKYGNYTMENRIEMYKNLMEFNETHTLDISPSMTPLTVYRASLAHKTNHGFFNVNAEFCFVKHPRFGLIAAICSLQSIASGQEIFVNYNYGQPSDTTPDWYNQLYRKTFGDNLKVNE